MHYAPLGRIKPCHLYSEYIKENLIVVKIHLETRNFRMSSFFWRMMEISQGMIEKFFSINADEEIDEKKKWWSFYFQKMGIIQEMA